MTASWACWLGSRTPLSTNPIIGRAGLIPSALETTVHHRFAGQVQYGLEEVVVGPHLVVEGVEHPTLRRSVQPFVAQVGSHQCVILLLDDAVIILAVGPAPAQLQADDLLAPEPDHVIIEELAAVIGVQLEDRERQAVQDAPKASFHGLLGCAPARPLARSNL